MTKRFRISTTPFMLLAGLVLILPSANCKADEPLLKITSPTSPLVVSPGDQITVDVYADKNTSFLPPNDPVTVFWDSFRTQPPLLKCTKNENIYRCSAILPGNTVLAEAEIRAVSAVMVNNIVKQVKSEPIKVDIEMKQPPLGLSTKPERLIIDRVGDRAGLLLVQGKFPDGIIRQLNFSSRIKFLSDNANIITVGGDGDVHAVGKGLATITVSYENISTKVPVSVDTSPTINTANNAAFKIDAATVEKYRQAAEKGDPQAQYDLGMAYHNGAGAPKDDIEARKWWLKATEQGHQPAYLLLCHSILPEYLSTTPDVDSPRITDFIAPVDQDIWRKWCSVSRVVKYSGEDYTTELYSRAEKGDVVAQRNLGLAYQIGGFYTAMSEPSKALPWFRTAAEGGDAVSQRNLGIIYLTGSSSPGFTPDYTEALKYFQKAAAQNDALSETFVGKIYSDGVGGIQKNPTEALKWYQAAASQGESNAERKLGDMFAEGTGIEKNPNEMIRWYSLAATHGDQKSAFILGADYAKGVKGVLAQDDKAAYKWLSLAGVQGIQSITTLGFAPLDTSIVQGAPPSPEALEKSYMWLKAASAMGDAKATDRIADITKQMNPDQIAEAEKMYRNLTSITQ